MFMIMAMAVAMGEMVSSLFIIMRWFSMCLFMVVIVLLPSKHSIGYSPIGKSAKSCRYETFTILTALLSLSSIDC